MNNPQLEALVARDLVLPAIDLAKKRAELLATITEAEAELARNPSIALAMRIEEAKRMVVRGGREIEAKYAELTPNKN